MRQLILSCVTVLLLSTSAGTAAQGIPDDQYQQLKQAYPSFAKAEARLNEAYRLVRAEADPLEAEGLRRQQRAWINERGAVYESIGANDELDESQKVDVLTTMAAEREHQIKVLEEKFNRVPVEDEPEGLEIDDAPLEAVADSVVPDTSPQAAPQPSLEANHQREAINEMLMWYYAGAVFLVAVLLLVKVSRAIQAAKQRRMRQEQLTAIADDMANQICAHAAGALTRLRVEQEVLARREELQAAERDLKIALTERKG